MPRGQTTQNGRKRRAPINNNTINQKDDLAAAVAEKISEKPSTSAKAIKKLFPLPVPQRSAIKGSALVCGLGDVGQLGLGNHESKFERRRPALVAGLKDVVDVCAGGMHTLVLTSNGLVYSFGCNDEGALGRDSSEEGSEYEPGVVDLPDKVVKISAGDSHSACLLEDGKVMAWGSFRDSHGNMGLTLDGNKRVPCDLLPGITCCSIASGADHLVMLTCAGHIYTIGCAEQGQLGRISQRSASGEGRRGKTDLLRPCRVITLKCKLVDAIWATNYCTFIQEARTGRIFAFGLNNYYQLAYEKENGVVVNPVLTDCTNVKKIAGGQHHTMILKNDGTVHVVGRHDYGRLGLGAIKEDISSLKPVQSLSGKFIVDISCGEATSFAITKNGDLYSWGIGSNNQLGTGSEEDALEPTKIESKETLNKQILQAGSGGQHSVFLVKAQNTERQGSSEIPDTTSANNKASKKKESNKKGSTSKSTSQESS